VGFVPPHRILIYIIRPDPPSTKASLGKCGCFQGVHFRRGLHRILR